MNKIESALIDEMTSEKLMEIAADGLEVTLDSFLSDGILKEVPFFGTLYKSSQAVLGIKDAIFAKMVFKFLFELKDIPHEKRKAFVHKLETDGQYGKKVGEKLIVIIDKLDDLDKASIIGRLLKYVIDEKINFEDFLRISAVIQKAFLPDLMFLKQHSYIEHYKPIIREHLMILGLIRMELEDDNHAKTIKEMSSIGGKVATPQKIKFELNALGEQVRLFLKECT